MLNGERTNLQNKNLQYRDRELLGWPSFVIDVLKGRVEVKIHL